MSFHYVSENVSSCLIFSINHAHTTVVFSTSDHISTLLKLASKTPCVKLIVIIDTIPPQSAKLFAEWGQSVGIRIQELHERASLVFANAVHQINIAPVEAYGKANLIAPIKPTPDTIATICYTSVSD